MIPSTDPTIARVNAKLRDLLSKRVLAHCYTSFQSEERVHFIVDTKVQDSFIFEDKIIEIATLYMGNPYTVNFEKIKEGMTFAQNILPLVYLKSNFSLDLVKKVKQGQILKVLKTCIKGSGDLFRISQKFLECRKCSDSEKKKLGLKYDLSSDEMAVKFFRQTLEIYKKRFNRDAVFIFRNMKPNFKIMNLSSTLTFLEKLEKFPTALILIVPKQFEHCLLPVWDKFSYIRLNKIDYGEIETVIKSLYEDPKVNEDLNFNEGAIQLFCRRMRSLFGKEVPASSLIKAFDDLLSYKKLHDLDIIDVKVINDFFSTSQLKIGTPTARPPSAYKTSYFRSEIDRLTAECKRLKLDPRYALPYPFKKVLWHLRKGDIIYNEEKDIFICRKYMRYNEFQKLSQSLSKIGYKYIRGTRTWVLSPRKS